MPMNREIRSRLPDFQVNAHLVLLAHPRVHPSELVPSPSPLPYRSPRPDCRIRMTLITVDDCNESRSNGRVTVQRQY